MPHELLLETIRCEHGVVHHLHYHQQRLNRSLKELGIKASYPLDTIIKPPDNTLYRCRFLANDIQYMVEYHPYTQRAISTLRLIEDNTIDYPHKFANRRELDTLFEQRNGCDDILIVKNSLITDTSIANIAFWLDKQWLTPHTPLLYGTTRERLLKEHLIKTAHISPNDALKAPKIMLFNAMMGCFELQNGIMRQI